MTKPAGYSVILNKETFDLLQGVKIDIAERMGFEPTNGQAIRHLIAVFYGEAEISSK
jgi:hypothetical protein